MLTDQWPDQKKKKKEKKKKKIKKSKNNRSACNNEQRVSVVRVIAWCIPSEEWIVVPASVYRHCDPDYR